MSGSESYRRILEAVNDGISNLRFQISDHASLLRFALKGMIDREPSKEFLLREGSSLFLLIMAPRGFGQMPLAS